MLRSLVVAATLMTALAAAGCGARPAPGPIGVPGAGSYEPYGPNASSNCGALGNCPVTNPERLNNWDLHGGG